MRDEEYKRKLCERVARDQETRLSPFRDICASVGYAENSVVSTGNSPSTINQSPPYASLSHLQIEDFVIISIGIICLISIILLILNAVWNRFIKKRRKIFSAMTSGKSDVTV